MTKTEALKILGLDHSASADDIKKKFRKLAYKQHPDRNKDPNAEEQYKKLSEAYEYLKNPPQEPKMPNYSWGPFGFDNFTDSFFNRNTVYRTKIDPISVSVDLTFAESVIGAKKKLSFDRVGPCNSCKGLKFDPCSTCSGKGYSENVRREGYVIFTNRSVCIQCSGEGHNKSKCTTCNNIGTKKQHIEVDVNIPGGVIDKQIIRLKNAGNVYIDSAGLRQGDVHLITNVEKDTDMRVVGQDVISDIEVSLYEALKGTTRKVRTVKGDLTILIRKNAKHNDKINMSGYGVEGRGNHIFNINVCYPQDTEKLIQFLENKE